MNHLDAITAVLGRTRLDLSNEATCQQGIARALETAGIPFEREAWLTRSDRIDFLVDRVGLEVKLKGQARAVYRQCQRYCETGRLEALALVTARAMGLPPVISGVRTRVISLGVAWL